jgi:hypothetical protein
MGGKIWGLHLQSTREDFSVAGAGQSGRGRRGAGSRGLVCGGRGSSRGLRRIGSGLLGALGGSVRGLSSGLGSGLGSSGRSGLGGSVRSGLGGRGGCRRVGGD